MYPKLNVPGLTTRMSISGGNRVRDCHNQSPLKRPRAKEPQIKALFHFVHGFYFVYVRYWRVHFYGHQPLHKLLIVIVFRCVTVKITVKLRNMHWIVVEGIRNRCFLRVSSCAFQALLAPARHFFNGRRLIQSCGDNDINGFIVKRLNTGLVFLNGMRKSFSF